MRSAVDVNERPPARCCTPTAPRQRAHLRTATASREIAARGKVLTGWATTLCGCSRTRLIKSRFGDSHSSWQPSAAKRHAQLPWPSILRRLLRAQASSTHHGAVFPQRPALQFSSRLAVAARRTLRIQSFDLWRTRSHPGKEGLPTLPPTCSYGLGWTAGGDGIPPAQLEGPRASSPCGRGSATLD